MNSDRSVLYTTLAYICDIFDKILTIRTTQRGWREFKWWFRRILDGIVFSWLYVVRFVLRGTMSRWVAMRDAARECQARCINRSDTFDFSFLRLHYSGARVITDPAWLRLRASCRDWIALVEDSECHRNGKRCSAFQSGWYSEEAAKWCINSTVYLRITFIANSFFFY